MEYLEGNDMAQIIDMKKSLINAVEKLKLPKTPTNYLYFESCYLLKKSVTGKPFALPLFLVQEKEARKAARQSAARSRNQILSPEEEDSDGEVGCHQNGHLASFYYSIGKNSQDSYEVAKALGGIVCQDVSLAWVKRFINLQVCITSFRGSEGYSCRAEVLDGIENLVEGEDDYNEFLMYYSVCRIQKNWRARQPARQARINHLKQLARKVAVTIACLPPGYHKCLPDGGELYKKDKEDLLVDFNSYIC